MDKKQEYIINLITLAHRWIEIADRKATILLSISSALLTVAPVTIAKIDNINKTTIAVAMTVDVIAILFSLLVLSPRLNRLTILDKIKPPKDSDTKVLKLSPTYFGDMATLSKSEYKSHINQILQDKTENSIEEDRLEQAYSLNIIALKKMKGVRVAAFFYFLSIAIITTSSITAYNN